MVTHDRNEDVLEVADRLVREQLDIQLPEGLMIRDHRPWRTHVSVAGRHRESTNLEDAIYHGVYKRMRVDDYDDDDKDARVFEGHFGHFAVGWVEEIFVQVYEDNGETYTPEFLKGCELLLAREHGEIGDEAEEKLIQLQLSELEDFWEIPPSLLEDVYLEIEDSFADLQSHHVTPAVEKVITQRVWEQRQASTMTPGQLDLDGNVVWVPDKMADDEWDSLLDLAERYNIPVGKGER